MTHHIQSVGQSKKDILMTLLSNAGGLFPVVVNHSGVYVSYAKVQLRGRRVYLYTYFSVKYSLCVCVLSFENCLWCMRFFMSGICMYCLVRLRSISYQIIFQMSQRYHGSVLSDVTTVDRDWERLFFFF